MNAGVNEVKEKQQTRNSVNITQQRNGQRTGLKTRKMKIAIKTLADIMARIVVVWGFVEVFLIDNLECRM